MNTERNMEIYSYDKIDFSNDNETLLKIFEDLKQKKKLYEKNSEYIDYTYEDHDIYLKMYNDIEKLKKKLNLCY